MSEYASKIALGAVVAVIVGSLLVAGFYYLPQSTGGPATTTQTLTVTGNGTTVGSGGTTFISTVGGGTTQTGSVITGIVNHTQTDTETGNFTTVTTTQSGFPCTQSYPNGTAPFDAPSIKLQEDSTAYICVRYYYYNSSSTISVNTSKIFGLAGYRSTSYGFDALSNFTITVSPEILTLGGPQNLNEGSLVLYAIQAKSNSSGTYNYGFQAVIYPSFEVCNGLSRLIVGTGSPNYNVGFGSCTAPYTNIYPLNSEGFINGTVIVQLVGITNSTS